MHLSTSFLQNLSFVYGTSAYAHGYYQQLGCLQLHFPLSAHQYQLKQQQIYPGDLYIFHQSLSFLFLLFAAALGYFLYNCGIFIKLSIYQILQCLKIIIWYKKLPSGITSFHLV